MKRLVSVAGLLLALFFLQAEQALCGAPLELAVSLNVLQEELRACLRKGDCTEDVLQLGGLTKIEGYVLDEINDDLILFGQVDSSAPPLFTENLAVALRNAWLKYAEPKGYTLYYSDPGCSIDPNSGVMAQLDKVGVQLQAGTSGSIADELERWKTVCSQPQSVRVLGIPFHTRFARIMVDADYYMKRLVDGSVSLNIPGFRSLMDITLEKAKKDILKNQNTSLQVSMMNRFWFYPGENAYQYDEGIVRIEKCPVILLTEEQYLTKGRDLSGLGRPNPLAQQFAEGLTTHYAEVAQQKPIYLELEGLFRSVAISKILKERHEHFDLDILLDQMPITDVRVDLTLPGISNVKEFRHRRDFSNSYEIVDLWLPTCGGVTIEIRADPKDFMRDKKGELAKIRKSILNFRPSKTALAWEFHN